MLDLRALPRTLIFGLATLTASSFVHAAEKTIFGLYEKVFVNEINLELAAKLDTGAQTSSLSAKEIEYFVRDDEPWVRFVLAIEGVSKLSHEAPLARISHIKRRAADLEDDDQRTHNERPVVTMSVCMDGQQHAIEVNLTDRSHFSYPLLIGASALKQFNALIDPALEYATQPCVSGGDSRQEQN